MLNGIPKLTESGSRALAEKSPDLSLKCRHVLVQVDGSKSLDDIRKALDGLDGIEEAIEKLVGQKYISVTTSCRDAVKSIAEQMLGAKAPTIVKKIDELYYKHGEYCWEHVDEIDKTARLFYGKVLADRLKDAIDKVLKESGRG